MSDPTGGLRDRYITESLMDTVHAILTDQGWLDPNPSGRSPITVSREPLPAPEEIAVNSVGFDFGDTRTEAAEVGSSLTVGYYTFAVDVFAEKASLGLQVSGDILAGLTGELPDIGRISPVVEVTDRGATPTVLFVCALEDLARDRAPAPTGASAWRKNWYSIVGTIVDDNYKG